MPRIVLTDLETDRSLSSSELDAVIGRDPLCAFPIEGPNARVVSGNHARIFFQDERWWIQDLSRNGTVLDNERLIKGERHGIKVGQVVGLGESGPRLKVVMLEARAVAHTVLELPDLDAKAPPKVTTAPRPGAPGSAPPAPPPSVPAQTSALQDAATTAMRKSEMVRAGLRVEEPTEPAGPSHHWNVHAVLRNTHTNQVFDVHGVVVKLGRSPECQVQIPPEAGAAVSRFHAEIAIEGSGIVVRDSASRNGTFVNGQRIAQPHPAHKNDLVMLGSGGPTFAIEDLRIVKDEARDREPPRGGKPGDGGAGGAKPAPLPAEPPTGDPKPLKKDSLMGRVMGPATRLARRSFAGAGRTAFFKDILEDVSRKTARRVRYVVWSSVLATVAIAAALLWVTQARVAASELRVTQAGALYEARADSVRLAAAAESERLRAEFDSARLASAPRAVVDSLRGALADAARRTGMLEQALERAQRALDDQMEAGERARRHADGELARLRAEVSRAQGSEASFAAIDSLRRALKDAETRALDVATQMRALRGSNLAQVAQMNQGAVGLVFVTVDGKAFTGSGFAITPSGYFVTNRHVVTGPPPQERRADSIFVTMADQRFTFAVRAEISAISTEHDVAVLKISGYRGPYVKKVDWAARGAVQGEPAALIGFPDGMNLAFDDTVSNVVRTSMSAGIFSKVGPEQVQFDGFTVRGSSGSPIFNADGLVVAVHKAGLKGNVGLGFAVPMSRVAMLLPREARSELGLP